VTMDERAVTPAALTFYFDLEAGDFLRVQELLTRESLAPRIIRLLPIVFVAIAAGVLLLAWPPSAGVAVPVVSGAVILLFSSYVFAPWQRARAIRKLIVSSPLYQHELRYEFSADGLRSISPVSTTDYRWEGFLRARETRDFFLLYVAAGRAVFLPKSAVRSPADAQALRTLVAGSMARLGRPFVIDDPEVKESR